MAVQEKADRRPARAERFDSREQEAFLNLWRTYDRLKAMEDELFLQHDLTAQQYNALRLLKAAHPQSLPTSTLGDKLVSRAPDMTRLLDKLESRGLVGRTRRPQNRRVVEVAIAPAGLKLLDRLARPVRECHQRQLGHLDADQLASLVALLQAARHPHEEAASVWRAE